MEESGVTKLVSVRLEHEELVLAKEEAPQHELWDDEGNFTEEDVSPEEGRELPIGVNDPRKVTEAQLRPIRAAKPQTAPQS